jgi:hypothetical protein
LNAKAIALFYGDFRSQSAHSGRPERLLVAHHGIENGQKLAADSFLANKITNSAAD